MFFAEYSEFIEALYSVRYAHIDENTKELFYKKIYAEYENFGEENADFEEIYNDLTRGVVHALKESDLAFLKVYNGLLLSISTLLSLKIKIHYLESSNYIKRIYPVEKKDENHHCLRCDNREKDKFFSFVSDNITTTYCKRCLEFGRCDDFFMKFHIDIPFLDFVLPREPAVVLSDIQDEASKKLVENSKCGKKTLVWAVCGAGKTEIVYEVIYDALKNKKKICMAIPRKDVVKELRIRFSRDFSNVPINILHGDEKTLIESYFYLMTTHQLVKYYSYFDVVIIDEVDAFPYYGDECLEQGALTSLKKNGSLIFLSATPSEKVKKAVDEVIKIPIRYHRYLLPVPKIKIDNKKVFTYEKKSKIIMQFIERSLKEKRRILIFVPTIEMSKSVKEYVKNLLKNEVIVDCVYSSDELRSEKIAKFQKWEINILVTTTILERGVTFDYLDILIFDANHKNFTKESLIQIAGRAGRKDYDHNGEVIFLTDKVNKNIKGAIKEIEYMNQLAKHRKLNRR